MTITDKNLKYAEARALGHSPESAADQVGYSSCTAVEKKLETNQDMQQYYEQCRQRYSNVVFDLGMLTAQKIRERLETKGKQAPSESFLLDLFKHLGNTISPPQTQTNSSPPIQINNYQENKGIENLESRVAALNSAIDRVKK